MKSQRGITLASLLIYIVAMGVVISIIAIISNFYNKNIINMNNTGDLNLELNKFVANMIQETKTAGNKVTEVNTDMISFENGNNYIFRDNRIYENSIVLSQYVSEFNARLETDGDKQLLKIYIVLQKNKSEIVQNLSYTVQLSNDFKISEKPSYVMSNGAIPIKTVEQLRKIGTGEIVEVSGKEYEFTADAKYSLKQNIEFTGSYTDIANKFQTNNINLESNGYQIIVTNSSGIKEYYNENSKYYIATNKYGYVLNGLVLYYDGEDNTGNGHSSTTTTWKDLSGNGHDGTLNKFSLTTSSGWNSNYLTLDGTDDWVNCTVVNNNYTTLDISYKPVSKTARMNICGNWEGGGVGMFITNLKTSSEAYVASAYRTIANPNNVSASSIVRQTMTFDGTTLKSYINNKLEGSTNVTGTIGVPGGNTVMAIGVNPSGTTSGDGGFFQGNVYSLKIYNRALTTEELEINYNADLARF